MFQSSNGLIRTGLNNITVSIRQLSLLDWIETGLMSRRCVDLQDLPDGHGCIATTGQGELQPERTEAAICIREAKQG